jgi:hypothetical protein
MDNVQPRNAGRRFYPPVTIENLLAEVAAGKTLAEVCENRQYPCEKTFYTYLAESPELAQRYALAVSARRAKQKEAA